MATEVRIPTTGNAGEDAVLVEWLVGVGDHVDDGQTLLTIETAKSTVDVVAPTTGTLLAQHAQPGDEVAEFSVIAAIGEAGECVDAAPQPSAEASPTPGDESPAEPAEMPLEPDVAPASTQADPAPAAPNRTRVSASPRAKRTADARGVDIATVSGTGPLGRVIAADVERAAAQEGTAPSSPAPSTTAPAAPAASTAVAQASLPDSPLEPARIVPVRGARKVTAQRIHASLANTAQVTLTRYADANRLLDWVGRLRAAADGDETKPRVGVNDALLFAAARVVVRHPEANSWFDWDGIRQFDRVDLGFAVDTDGGLYVPVIRDAHLLTVGALATQAQGAISRAREGRLQPDEMAGGTFTVSNLGGLGVHWFTPVLNTPQSCILGIGATHRSGDGSTMLPLSLTFDHRALDGGAAASLLADIATAIGHIDVLDAF